MPALVAVDLARFCKGGVAPSQPPALDALLSELLAPGTDERAGQYLALRPDVCDSLQVIVDRVCEESRRKIELAAYYRYVNRGADHGRDVDDWLAVERELVAKELSAACDADVTR